MTAFVVCVALALLLAAGLVVDGGRIVDARLAAADIAGGAARAGAQAVTGIRGGQPALDAGQATAQAHAFLAAAGVAGSAHVHDGTVVVEARVTRRLALLGLVGLGPRTVTASRAARPAGG